MRARFVEHLARIQQHRAAPDDGEVALDFVSLDVGLILDQGVHQVTKLGNVPLPIADLIEKPPLNLIRHEPEDLIKRAAGGDDTQVLFEHHKGTRDRIDDGLRQRKCVLDGG